MGQPIRENHVRLKTNSETAGILSKTSRVDSTHLKGAALFLSILCLKRTGPTLTSTPRVILLTTTNETRTDHDKNQNTRPCLHRPRTMLNQFEHN